jgi:hypothetical protein
VRREKVAEVESIAAARKLVRTRARIRTKRLRPKAAQRAIYPAFEWTPPCPLLHLQDFFPIFDRDFSARLA